ncbi:MAG: UDP-N-acetylglucosamine 1-carboxyvinyltransferase [bacterium]
MSTITIRGGRPLQGQIQVRGMKNAVLPIIAACLLVPEPVVLKNVPRILDVENLLQTLAQMGAGVKWLGDHEVQINCKNIDPSKMDPEVARKMRASILLLAPLFGRFHEARVGEPGGDKIGARPMDSHKFVLRALGANLLEQDRIFTVLGKPRAARLMIPENSVTATEMAVMAAVLAPGTSEIHSPALEPHVQDLAGFLNACGAKISGAGSVCITINGVKKLHGAEYTIIPDQLEVGTFAILAAATKSAIDIVGVEPDHLDMIIYKLREAGADVTIKDRTLLVRPAPLKAVILRTAIYPGFPTDLQGPFALLATQCSGVSLIHDPIYEDRFGYVKTLTKMGANITQCDPHRIVVSGPTALVGGETPALDIRAGATFIIAGLLAEGTTVIRDADHIDRGYEKIVPRLQALGADIERN